MTTTRASIHALPEQLINQIAAGEVIERPMSVVKELVENSLDAGATRIDIEIAAGGVDLITVSDNGSGIAGHEISAAFKRHWTSKISHADDLERILSLGFRGEALASIAAVADVSIVTRTADAAHAWQFEFPAASAEQAPRPAQGNQGTYIAVRKLFHRIPARKRFLKQARTEYLQVYRLLRAFGFARPDVTFTLIQGGSRGLRLRPAEYAVIAPRWQTLFGKAFCDSAHSIMSTIDGFTICGWVGGPELATNLADTQFVALNGRVIRDKHVQHAVRLAYDTSIAAGRFPSYALALQIAASEVDVNVHPGKMEVRFSDVRTLHDLTYTAVKQALAGMPERQTSAHQATLPNQPAALSEARAPYAKASFARVRAPAVAFGKPLALVEERFVLFSLDAATYALDLVAAWREVLVRRLTDAGVVERSSRPLLLPQRLPRGTASADVLTCPGLAELGVVIDDLGQAGALVRALPSVLPTLDYAKFVQLLAQCTAAGASALDVVASSAAKSINFGASGQPAHAMLDELARSAQAANCDLAALAVCVTASALERLGRHD